jgi:hypothetical protein
VIGVGDVHAGLNAHCDVVAAGGIVKQRTIADGDVVVAGGILMKRTIADSFVGPACRIAGERRRTKGVVAVTRGIAKK